MLVAMLDGIARAGRAAAAAADERLPARRPRSAAAHAEASLAAFEADAALLGALDPEFVQAFVALKRHEIAKAQAANPGYGGDEWHDQVTEWERGQFLFLA